MGFKLFRNTSLLSRVLLIMNAYHSINCQVSSALDPQLEARGIEQPLSPLLGMADAFVVQKLVLVQSSHHMRCNLNAHL